jgi:hypothetical protein
MFRVTVGLSLALIFGLFAWLPHAAAQDDTYRVDISALNCPTEDDAADWSPANPDSPCDSGLGITFTVTDASTGAEYGSCVSDWMPPSMGTGCSVTGAAGAQVIVTEDTSTVAASYLPVENPIVAAQPAEGEFASANFINVLQEAPPVQDVPPAQQDDTYDLPIQVANCADYPNGQEFQGFGNQCEPALGLGFTVVDFNTGDVYGSCESEAFEALYAQCTVTVPVGSTVIVSEDATPEGYTLWISPGTIDIAEAAIQAGEGAFAPFVNVLLQSETYNLPILAINCPAQPGPDEFPFENWDHPCEPAPGISFTVRAIGTGETVGTCVTIVFDAPEPQSAASCIVPVTVGMTVDVIEDVSTIPANYQPVEPTTVTVTAPNGVDSTDQPEARFINVAGTPSGGEPTTALPSTGGGLTTQLPNTGAGPSFNHLVSFFR